MPEGSLRVAVLQLAGGPDVAANLATVRRLLDEAAAQGATLAVTPEFCNHPSVYESAEHAWSVAVEVDGDFVGGVADKAREHAMAVMLNATVRRGREVNGSARITDTNLLFGPDGALLATSDKQVLMGAERFHLAAGESVCNIIDLSGARVAMYSCMDGVINETPRALALRGAQVLLNSLSSFALDEAALHIPVRAAENKVWVLAANKTGPLLTDEAAQRISAGMGVPVDRLVGAGESQVVAPDGTVVARAPSTGEAVVVVDIEPARADDKTRPDGTDVVASRRPELYADIGKPPTETVPPRPGAAELEVAAVAPERAADAARLVAEAVASGARLVVLPELAAYDDGLVGGVPVDAPFLHELAAAAGDAAVVTSVQEADAHVGVVVTRAGVVARQPQLHRSERHARWVRRLGDGLAVVDMPWGRLAVAVGDDSVYPETFRLAALQRAEVVAVPFTALETWETTIGLPERAAENRVSVVAATRPRPAGSSLVLSLNAEAALWGAREFDGTISFPLIARALPGEPVLRGTVHPAHAASREITLNTDLVDGRPWHLVDAITSVPG